MRRRRIRPRAEVLVAALGATCVVACAGPSRSELAERSAEVRRLQSARAVHVPKGVESCVGVTLRLADSAAPAEAVAARTEMAARVTPEEVRGAVEKSGAAECKRPFDQAIRDKAVSAEPLRIALAYGVDGDGRVCAVVERARMEPIDPAAQSILEDAAECLKNALFRAEFPAGRVKDKERIILEEVLLLDPAAALQAGT